MSQESDLINFSRELESDITDQAKPDGDSSSASFRESALTEIISQELEACGVLEPFVVCHFEGGHGAGSFKVAGYSVPDEDSRLDLFITHYGGPFDEVQTINASHIEASFNKLERYFSLAIKGHHRNLEPGLEPYGMTEQIYNLRNKFDRVNFLLFTNARLVQRREKERKQEVNGLAATYDVWDLERFRRLRQSGLGHEPVQIDLGFLKAGGLPAVKVEPENSKSQTWVTIFPGSLLADLYDEYGGKILELNVRSYLQARGKVNKGILQTLRDKPEYFMAYNNGITVVAEDVVVGTLHDGTNGILSLKGMQIVNGGQTTASIHRGAKDFKVDLSRVSVQGKITVVESSQFQELVPFISRYSNTQNKVTESDLTANQPFHIGMERVSRREWTPNQQTHWFYERARGGYTTEKMREGTTELKKRDFEKRYPPEQRFAKEDLAKFENAWMGLPHIASRGAQKNFVYFMMHGLGKIPDGWEPTVEEYRRYVAKGILYKEVQRIVKRNEAITAYRINVTAYTAALLADKTDRRIDLDRIWREQGISPSLAQTIESWAPTVFEKLPVIGLRDHKHIEESFKSDACWDYICSLSWNIPNTLEQELISSTGASGDRETGLGPVGGVALCPGCYQDFPRTTTWQKWCSSNCRMKAYRNRKVL